jgi:hypothetical protein
VAGAVADAAAANAAVADATSTDEASVGASRSSKLAA